MKSFVTADEVDEWLYNNPMHCPGALHFVDRNSSVISYGIQTNSTSVIKRGKFEDPTSKFQIPLQIAAEREIARSLIGGTNSCVQEEDKKRNNNKAKIIDKIAFINSSVYVLD